MLRYSLAVFLLLAGAAVAAVPESKPLRPNIILIMVDDMGFSDIGCYGGEVKTPNIDKLAREGMRFTSFYNNAKCTTTRASILTGLFPRFGSGGHLRTDMVTLGEAMKKAGYQTALSGKWHLGSGETTHPYKRGFDTYYGLLDGCCNFFDPSQPDPPYKGGKVRKFGFNDQLIKEFPKDYYTTDAFTDHSVAAIQHFHQTGEPFLLHLCYTAPHYPLHAKPADIAKYKGKFTMGWDQMRKDRFDRQKKMGIADDTWKLSEEDSRAYSWEKANHEFEDHRMAVYAAMIDSVDQNIARLLEVLTNTGELDNTVIFFLSDNGGCSEEPGGRDPEKRNPGPKDDYVAVGPAWGWAQNAPFRRYKSWVHEGGTCTPLIAWWPGQIKANTITREVGHIIDFLPTFLELAGVEYPAEHNGKKIIPVEGRSLLPILSGGKVERLDGLGWFWAGNRAFREGDWKVVWDSGPKKWELYNLAVDRCETEDLTAKEPGKAADLTKKWFAWAEKVGLKVKE
ncbi:MAG: arylsulfatase [Phycisphaeraceae bacterium]